MIVFGSKDVERSITRCIINVDIQKEETKTGEARKLRKEVSELWFGLCFGPMVRSGNDVSFTTFE